EEHQQRERPVESRESLVQLLTLVSGSRSRDSLPALRLNLRLHIRIKYDAAPRSRRAYLRCTQSERPLQVRTFQARPTEIGAVHDCTRQSRSTQIRSSQVGIN